MAHTGAITPHRSDRRLSHLQRHFLQMFGVMVAGMILSAAVFLAVVGTTWEEATLDHPLASLLVIAAGMTVPMTIWMLQRGMGARSSIEMAGAMALPAVPFISLVWFGVTKSALCGPYCIVAVAAMIGLMLYRRDEYSTGRTWKGAQSGS